MYCVAALGRAEAAEVVDLIDNPLDELPYESLRERLTMWLLVLLSTCFTSSSSVLQCHLQPLVVSS